MVSVVEETCRRGRALWTGIGDGRRGAERTGDVEFGVVVRRKIVVFVLVLVLVLVLVAVGEGALRGNRGTGGFGEGFRLRGVPGPVAFTVDPDLELEATSAGEVEGEGDPRVLLFAAAGVFSLGVGMVGFEGDTMEATSTCDGGGGGGGGGGGARPGEGRPKVETWSSSSTLEAALARRAGSRV